MGKKCADSLWREAGSARDPCGRAELAGNLCSLYQTAGRVVRRADQDALAQATKVLEGYADRLRVRVVSRQSLAQTIEHVRGVSRGQIVLLVTMIRDSEGRALSSREVARQLAAVSQAPIYGLSGTIMDTGAVGGALVDFAAVGRKAAEVALKVLDGARVPVGSPETKSRTSLVVDWRALQHWTR